MKEEGSSLCDVFSWWVDWLVGQLGPFDSLFAVSLTVTVKDTAIKLPISEPRSCVTVEVDVLGSPSQIVRTVSVDEKQQ